MKFTKSILSVLMALVMLVPTTVFAGTATAKPMDSSSGKYYSSYDFEIVKATQGKEPVGNTKEFSFTLEPEKKYTLEKYDVTIVKSGETAVNVDFICKNYPTQKLTVTDKKTTNVVELLKGNPYIVSVNCVGALAELNKHDILTAEDFKKVTNKINEHFEIVITKHACQFVTETTDKNVITYCKNCGAIDENKTICFHNNGTNTKPIEKATHFATGTAGVYCNDCKKLMKTVGIKKIQPIINSIKIKKNSAIIRIAQVTDATYEIQYSTNKTMSTSKVVKTKYTSKTIKKLKKGKKYYVRVRACSNGKYSDWSKIKAVKIKK